jgi:transcriptional regulator of acetoin/glycerol metabolism
MSPMNPMCPDGRSQRSGVDTGDTPCIIRCMTDEERQLREALAVADGSPTRAAALLGVSRVTVHRRMKKYGIEIKRVVDRAA